MVKTMHLNLEIPWERYALIAELVKRFDAQGMTLRKTALQKMVFLLQRVFGFDFDYNFTLYTYGPFCADVARDLDIVAGFGGADISYNPTYGGYELRPGGAIDELRRRGAEYLQTMSDALDQAVADYGHATAKELELRSTIIYLAKPGQSDEALIQLVQQVKPHFSTFQIETARRELAERGYLGKAKSVMGTQTAHR